MPETERFQRLIGDEIRVTTLEIAGQAITNSVLLGSSQVVDLNGEADALVLDADADTSISAPTDDQIDIEIANADDFRFTANTFTALSGSTIATNTIAETTADAGVTIDGVLIKDTAVAGRTSVLAVAADGAITIPAHNMHYFITKAGVAAMTIANPTSTTHDGVTLTFVATTANAHTLDNSAGAGFWSSGGAGKDVATFSGAIGDGLTIIAYQGKWYIDPRGTTGVTLG